MMRRLGLADGAGYSGSGGAARSRETEKRLNADVAVFTEVLASANEEIARLEREKLVLKKQLLVVPPANKVTFDSASEQPGAWFTADTPGDGAFMSSEGVPRAMAAAGGGVRFSLTGLPVVPLVAPLPPFSTAPVFGQRTSIPATARAGSTQESEGGFAYTPTFTGLTREREQYRKDHGDMAKFGLELARTIATKEQQQQRQRAGGDRPHRRDGSARVGFAIGSGGGEFGGGEFGSDGGRGTPQRTGLSAYATPPIRPRYQAQPQPRSRAAAPVPTTGHPAPTAPTPAAVPAPIPPRHQQQQVPPPLPPPPPPPRQQVTFEPASPVLPRFTGASRRSSAPTARAAAYTALPGTTAATARNTATNRINKVPPGRRLAARGGSIDRPVVENSRRIQVIPPPRDEEEGGGGKAGSGHGSSGSGSGFFL